ncbi:hypothetical protein RMSM_01148 [Rhodopirellula maiorica SM1]|uniref:Uncharacterized protein n=1 Tax=Rhodopirellula maiorica SM1 TaxID=1265738 RepID=M5S2R6_9BACT|nr:hypothetical protein [Rhodopirellula maiorica]EMI21927.1 hypothetical protein RMSM_01148 [Rhodopirellula maiorica SM1]
MTNNCIVRWGKTGKSRSKVKFEVASVDDHMETLNRQHGQRIQIYIKEKDTNRLLKKTRVRIHGTIEFSPEAARKLAIDLLREVSESDSIPASEIIKLLEISHQKNNEH